MIIYRTVRGPEKRVFPMNDPKSNSDWFCKSNNFEKLVEEPEISGVYKVPYPPPAGPQGGGRKFVKSVGEEIKS